MVFRRLLGMRSTVAGPPWLRIRQRKVAKTASACAFEALPQIALTYGGREPRRVERLYQTRIGLRFALC